MFIFGKKKSEKETIYDDVQETVTEEKAEAIVEETEAVIQEETPDEKKGLFAKLRDGLGKTRILHAEKRLE